ncbi:MAG: hypothetical protein PUB96_06865 [Helicobacteraceae bacterium]|nr:hypothetical protein [Helicobacteraceae bacterium]
MQILLLSSAILHLKVKSDFLPIVLALLLKSQIVKFQSKRYIKNSIISHWQINEAKKS